MHSSILQLTIIRRAVFSGVSCRQRDEVDTTTTPSKQNEEADSIREISNVYGIFNNDKPYKEALKSLDVNAELHESVGQRIQVIGAASSVDGKAALWMPDGNDTVTIKCKDIKEWSHEGKKSHRSLLLIHGDLSHDGSNFYTDKTTYRWIDS